MHTLQTTTLRTSLMIINNNCRHRLELMITAATTIQTKVTTVLLGFVLIATPPRLLYGGVDQEAPRYTPYLIKTQIPIIESVLNNFRTNQFLPFQLIFSLITVPRHNKSFKLLIYL